MVIFNSYVSLPEGIALGNLSCGMQSITRVMGLVSLSQKDPKGLYLTYIIPFQTKLHVHVISILSIDIL